MQNTITTPELFRLLSLSIGKEKAASAYAVAKVLGCTQSAAKNWELGNRVMDDSHAEKVAQRLGMDLDFVLLSLEAERRHKSGADKMAAVFARAAMAVHHNAAAIFLGVFLLFAGLAAPSPAQAATQGEAPEHCILCKIRSRFFRARRGRLRSFSPLVA